MSKKITILLLIAFAFTISFMVSCDEQPSKKPQPTAETPDPENHPHDRNIKREIANIWVDGFNSFEILTMDSCEYVGKSISGQEGLFSHRGRCKYCKERRMSEMREAFLQAMIQYDSLKAARKQN